MPTLLKIFIIFIVVTSSGCQLLTDIHSTFYDTTDDSVKVPAKFKIQQLYPLLEDSTVYSSMSVKQQKIICEQLKSAYKIQKDWQTAWLMAYSVNQNFTCLSLVDTLNILTKIQQQQPPASPLYWLNIHQINLLNKLSYLQSKNKKFKRKNKLLKENLNKTTLQLQDIVSKIQALKIIETTINQKTQ